MSVEGEVPAGEIAGGKIDAHHHFWIYRPEEHAWIRREMAVLRRDFLPTDLEGLLRSAGIGGAVTVQARQSLEETFWLLDLADSHQYLKGVVGWLPLAAPELAGHLEALADRPKLRGVRHILQDEADDSYMLRDDFNAGVGLLRDSGLAYDVLIYERHLPQAIRFVDRHPGQVFILDHVAKPRIRDATLSPWRENLQELARRENVYCKISGMVTEADWGKWTVEELRPYFEVALDAFGPRRLMFGSDWPVVLLAAEYGGWFSAVEAMIAGLSEHERERILGATAIEAYGL